MAKKKKVKKSTDWSGCGCPLGSKRISTKGRGRGWVCQSTTFRKTKNGRRIKPFVKAKCV